jgi:hypothetical protein
MMSDKGAFDIFKKLIVPYWLRPESALWYSHMIFNAKKYLGDIVESPSIDFGTMDGVNSLILMGGEFNFDFDIYGEVEWDTNSFKTFNGTHDYFNRIDENIVFPDLKNKPINQFCFGVDWKQSHIIKSTRLKVHKEFLLIDIENPFLNVKDRSIKTIWAPNIYWSPAIEKTLMELSRVLHPEGKIITIGPGSNQLSYMLTRFEGMLDPNWIADMDRGRSINSKRHSKSFLEWKSLFLKSGLDIKRSDGFISPLVAKTYDLGFRPMFPVFMQFYEKIKMHSLGDLIEVKQDWIDNITHFIHPLCQEVPHNEKNDAAWFIFELNLKQ